jgi:hypothetical protein
LLKIFSEIFFLKDSILKDSGLAKKSILKDSILKGSIDPIPVAFFVTRTLVVEVGHSPLLAQLSFYLPACPTSRPASGPPACLPVSSHYPLRWKMACSSASSSGIGFHALKNSH